MARKVGRPRHKPTKSGRALVELLMASGCTNESIAARLQISIPTFCLAYAPEIEAGRAKGRVKIVEMLIKSARGGNVSAQKKLEEMSRTADAAALAEVTADPVATAPAARPVGKKEQAAAEAADVQKSPTPDWGNDLNPHSVN